MDLSTGCPLKTNVLLDLNKLLKTIDLPNLWFLGRRCNFMKIEVYHLMLNDKRNVMTELASKAPISVEIIEIID